MNYMPSNNAEPKEHPITAVWVAEMKRERKAQGYTQTTLAVALRRTGLTCSQAMVSEIERGVTQSSALVVPISRLLKIAPPSYGLDDLDLEWMRIGARLRSKNDTLFKAWLTAIRGALGDVDPKTP